MKTTVFFTMQTSATASMWRIFTKIIGNRLVSEHFVDKYYRLGDIEKLKTAIIPEFNHLIQFNNPPFFNLGLDLANYKFIVNFRDPRDRLCNAFHWMLIHPVTPNETQESIDERAHALLEKGIDDWVLNRSGVEYYQNLFYVLDNANKSDTAVLSYARLCLDFDSFIEKAADFFEVPLTNALKDELEIERTEKLALNPQWIGNQWKGSDVIPGRFRNELKPETIEILNKKFSHILSKMAKFDPDYAYTYLLEIV